MRRARGPHVGPVAKGITWGVALALLGLGCEAAQGTPSSGDKAQPTPTLQDRAAGAPTRVQRPQRVPRVGAQTGNVVSNQPLAPGRAAAVDQTLELADQASLELHYPGGASVRLTGPAFARVSPDGEEALLVRNGHVQVDLPPSALHPEAGFWIATPGVRLEVLQTARFDLNAWESTGATLRVTSGRVGVLAADQDSPEVALVHETLHVTGHAGVRRAGPGAVGKDPSTQYPRDAAAPEPTLAAANARLSALVEAAAAAVSGSLAEERALGAQHRELVARKDPGAMDVQRRLAQHAVQVFRERRRLRVRLSLLEAASLGSASGTALAERAQALLR